MSRINAPSPRVSRPLASDHSLSDHFDAPWIEPVRMPDEAEPGKWIIRDVTFARLDMDYWEQWAAALRQKHKMINMADLAKKPGLSGAPYADAVATINRKDVQIFEVLDQQYVPGGIKKILDDSLRIGGLADGAERRRIVKCIGPLRQQEIATEVCSEPRATIEQLRDSVKQLAHKLGMDPVRVLSMDDQELIDFCVAYTPPSPVSEDDANPMNPGEASPGLESITEAPTLLSGTSSDANPESLPSGAGAT